MSRPTHQAQPPLTFIPPNYQPRVVRWVYRLLPVWMRFRTPVRQVEPHNLEELALLYKAFENKKIRLLLAFRHPSVSDPIAIGYMLSRYLPAAAKRQGIKFKQPIHVHFMYDRGIPLWAGSFMAWLYARMGGTSILRGKVDRPGLRSARELTVNGLFPMIAAPEGATNGHNEIIGPLEPGMAQLGFWCAEDLEKAGRDEQVWLVPIGVQFSYLESPWPAMDQQLTALETECGLSGSGQDPEAMYDRLYKLGLRVMDLMETHYQRAYPITLAKLPEDLTDPNERLTKRLERLLETALTIGETHFKVQPKGNRIDRCRRLEQCAWDIMYPENLDLESLSVTERRLADRAAQEADTYLWHVRLVESFSAVTGRYVKDKLNSARFSETLLLLWDSMSQIQGGRSPFDRPRFGSQKAKITIGTPMNVSDRYPQYRENRRGAKQAVETLTADLAVALESLVDR